MRRWYEEVGESKKAEPKGGRDKREAELIVRHDELGGKGGEQDVERRPLMDDVGKGWR